MMSIFKIVRLSMFAAILAFSFIVLGLAAFFDHIIIDNDLTHYIPLAIFVAACTLTIIPTLLVFGLLKRVLLISQVRSELTFVGLLGLLWFILGLYTAVEPDTVMTCDMEPGDFFELAVGSGSSDSPYTDEMYQLQFQVLKSFAIMNAAIHILYFLFLLLLTYRQHHMGRRQVWQSGVTSYQFFNGGKGDPAQEALMKSTGHQRLPTPVTAKIIQAPPRQTKDSPKLATPEGSPPMRAGGHYIMYIPPPPPPRRFR